MHSHFSVECTTDLVTTSGHCLGCCDLSASPSQNESSGANSVLREILGGCADGGSCTQCEARLVTADVTRFCALNLICSA